MRRNSRRVVYASCVWALLVTASSAGAETPRVAVLAQGGAEAAADLLTAALSAQTGIELVDREELARVARERGLAAEGLTAADSRDWGALLGAPFLVSVSVEPDPEEGKPPQALARVFVSGPGAILGFARAVDPQDLAEPVLRQVQAGLSAEGEWLPLSVLQFRFPQPVPDAAIIERDLTALTVSRLAAQPGILVLERAQLLQAVFERSLVGEDDPFWSGAYLVEGTIRREDDRFVVQPLLRAPGGGAAPGIPPVEFPADRLAEGAERIAAAVAEVLGRAAPGEVGWSHEAEAGVLLDEARWTRRHGHMRETLDLAEAALALGATHPDVRRLRMIAESNLAFPVSLRRDPSWPLSAWDAALGYGFMLNRQWRSVLDGNRLRMRDIPVLDSDLMTRSMAYAGRALAIALESFDPSNLDGAGRYRLHHLEPVTLPASVATALLVAMHRAGLEGSLTEEANELRALIQDLRDRVHRSNYFHRIPKDQYRFSSSSSQDQWAMLEMDYLGYWFERSGEAFDAYRSLLSLHLGQGSNAAVRWMLSRHSTAEETGTLDPIGSRDPRLIAARDVPAESFPEVWEQFIGELQADPDSRIRLDGHVIAALRAATPDEADAAYEQAMPLLLQLADDLVADQKINTYAILLTYTTEHRKTLDGRWVDLAERWFDHIPTRHASSSRRPPFFAVLDETARVSTPSAFRRADLGGDQQERLQAAMNRFHRRLTDQSNGSADRALPVVSVPRATIGGMGDYRYRLREAHATWVRAMYAAGPDEEYPRIRAMELAARFPGLRPHPSPREVIQAVEDDDRFWILLQAGWRQSTRRGDPPATYHLVEIHPQTQATRTLYSIEEPELGHQGGVFLVRNGPELLLIGAKRNSVLRFNPDADPVFLGEVAFDPPLGTIRSVGAVHGVLYVVEQTDEPGAGSSSSLRAVNPVTGRHEVVASSRRRPAQTLLDDGDSFYLNPLVEGPDGNIWAMHPHRNILRYQPHDRIIDRPLGRVRYPEMLYRMPDSTVFLTFEWHLWAIPDGPGPAIWINKNPGFLDRSIPTFPEPMQPLEDEPVFPYDTFQRFRLRHWNAYAETGLYFRDRELWVLWQGGLQVQGDWELHHWNLETGHHRARRLGPAITTRTMRDGRAFGQSRSILRPYADGILVGSRWITREDWEDDGLDE